jgi:hypothetical protein
MYSAISSTLTVVMSELGHKHGYTCVFPQCHNVASDVINKFMSDVNFVDFQVLLSSLDSHGPWVTEVILFQY